MEAYRDSEKASSSIYIYSKHGFE